MSVLRFQVDHAGETLTLKGLHTTEKAAQTQLERLLATGFTATSGVIKAPNGADLWIVASRRRFPQVDTTPFPRELRDLNWKLAFQADRMFRVIAADVKNNGQPFHWYKEIEPHRVRDVFAKVDWAAPLRGIAADILSKMVIAHPFPNANHRTAILVTTTFLQSHGVHWPDLELDAPQAMDQLYGGSYAFFTQSKFLLQLLQRRPVFRVAVEAGFSRFHLGWDRVVRATANHCTMTDRDLYAAHLAEAEAYIRRWSRREDRQLLNARFSLVPQRWLAYLEGT